MYHWCIFGATFFSLKIRKTLSDIIQEGFLILLKRRGRDSAAPLRGLRYLLPSRGAGQGK
jgi:hypothetical protein